jgi:23S rRNA (uracil1939-C5)-methyltransferase
MSTHLAPADPGILVTIEKLVHGGTGLTRDGARAVFVPYVIPGESVRVRVARAHKGYAEGRVVEVVTPSADRVRPPCSVYGRCGGCHLQHIQYPRQLELKRQILADTLTRIGKLRDIEVPPVVASPSSFAYRNRARFAVFRSSGTVSLAYHQEASHQLVPIAECPVMAPALNEILTGLNQVLNSTAVDTMGLQEVAIATSTTTGEAMIRYIAERATRRDAARWFAKVRERQPIKGQVLLSGQGQHARRWVDGDPTLTEQIRDCTFRISEGVFAQANWKLNELLIDTVQQWALGNTSGEAVRVLELYSGIGNFGLLLARAGAFVTLVEGNRSALADARANAKLNHIGRCRFRLTSAEGVLAGSSQGEYDLVLVDPPRTGLSKEVLGSLVRLGPDRLLYISCEPATLARDVHVLQESGYRLTRLQGFDMFPQTMHIETLAELVRKPSSALH